MKVVVDASAMLSLLLRTPSAERVAECLRKAAGSVHAPHLIDIEVAQILRHFAAAAPDQAQRCQQVLCDLSRMPIFRYSHASFLQRIWELRHITTSEATYVALAEFLDAAVVTFNDRLITQDHNARIELLPTP